MSRPAATRPRLGLAIRRGLLCRCPNCGRGRLLAGYLKQVEACSVCGEPFGHLRSDDAAPWLTILFVGHVTVPLALFVESHTDWPDWVSKTVWPGFALLLALFVLPRARCLFLSAIWATRGPGSEKD
ncbi:Uncharacterized conserved protein, DUF983 family [Tistlia consotensis]|uniref:Uncharacterized conserved protein, DUF983 family n=1 Tax=Tistlia consotensis USBA 355 TaxID=560819 RepID=A0A1Y6CDX8_9PROT|nr:DUF983 domain-containing protein [Tistlia consotensis]SMF58753.1 Uncharacterized conserved protein, DUF983 family [Tistlia consotensis USBA 355]SNR63850.1 Uncharacterized conserved protein, DUF983 family [Tistlia consotensis]